MAIIKLNLRELTLFLESCKELLNNSNKIISIEFDNEELANITDKISDNFTKKGLGKNYEPNALGLELENLNDKFITALQKNNNL